MTNSAELELALPVPPDPAEHQRNPYQTFLLLFSVIVSLPLLRGRAASGILEAELDDATVIAWGIALLVGSSLALVGQFWRGRLWTSLGLERGGVALVGSAAAIYAGVVYTTVDADPIDVGYILGVQLAYAGACGWRVGQITRRLSWLRTTLEGDQRPSRIRRVTGRPLRGLADALGRLPRRRP